MASVTTGTSNAASWEEDRERKTIIFNPVAGDICGWSFEEGAQFTVQKDGGLTVAVAEEQAVGSYNQSFECTLTMTRDQARFLRDWLAINIKD